jgi:hypothetical protein
VTVPLLFIAVPASVTLRALPRMVDPATASNPLQLIAISLEQEQTPSDAAQAAKTWTDSCRFRALALAILPAQRAEGQPTKRRLASRI